MSATPSPLSSGKRIAILTYGSRGDVEPFVALGVGLRAAGHEVRLAAPAAYESLAAGRGLGFTPIAGNPEALAQAFADRAGLSWPRMIARMMQHVLGIARTAIATTEVAASGADLIVHSFLMTDGGHSIAARLGVPDISAQLFPVFLTTSAFPAVALPDLPLGSAYRRLTHILNTATFRYGGRLLYRRLKSSDGALPDLAPWPFAANATPILFAYSPHVLRSPPDWPACAHVTGYWRLPPPEGWEPPRPLIRFLDSETPPMYFGPGSMMGARLDELLEAVVESARAVGQRILLGVPPSAIPGRVVGSDVMAASGIPHSWLFPRMSFILHHGGAGTTGAAAASGVPSSAVPISADQSFWARRIHRLGLGPLAPPAHRLSRRNLEPILKDAMSNPDYRRRSEDLAALLGREDGVAAAVGIIQARLGVPTA